MEDISEHSEEAIKFIKHCQKLKAYQAKWTELLTQDLLKLDGMEFTEENKPLRKEWITFIQGLLNDLDHIQLPDTK